MFRAATQQNTKRAVPQVGTITATQLPSLGLNARDTFTVMDPRYAISLVNVVVEPYGIRTRRGYTEWAKTLPPGPSGGALQPVWTMLGYYPPDAAPEPPARTPFYPHNQGRLLVKPRADPTPPVGKMFASRGGKLYDVTNGGTGPWTEEAGVEGESDHWTWMNFTNIGGTYLLATNDAGGYWIYDGTSWTAPAMGTDPGEIANVDPALFCYVMEFKKRLWFVEKDSTRAWYLPVSQITGAATMFDFGESAKQGGKLVSLHNWTVDAGEGMDDMLVAVASQGNVIVYKGLDPDTAETFSIHGVWNVGALPAGRRSVFSSGDIYILSQFGLTPLSALISTTQLGAVEQRRSTYVIAPLIARLMHDHSALDGWQINLIPAEELLLIGVPPDSPEMGGDFFALKVTTGAWQILKGLPYTSFINIDAAVFAGTRDGRVVRAFDGPLDDVLIDEIVGRRIKCQVTSAFNPCGTPGYQKVWKLCRPTFITTVKPSLKVTILVDYGPARAAVVPTLPDFPDSHWDTALWDVGRWSGLLDPIHEWFGCHGVGFVGTAQLDYSCGGDTLLANIDYWTEQGGVM